MDNQKIRERIKAYKLDTRVCLTVWVFVAFILSLVLYCIPFFRKNEISANILLALFTSLLVTICTCVIDIQVDYSKHKSDVFLDHMYQFGIGSMTRKKREVLQDLLKDCDKLIWISGYRLILTRELKDDIAKAVIRDAEITAVICPPWTEAFKMVYGENEKVMDNYYQVLHSIYKARVECKKDGERYDDEFKILFVNKPLFSDTYRVDQNLITGPYMHNSDPDYHRMMAKDFFSYTIVRDTELYDIVDGEFKTLCNEAIYKLDWRKFEEAYETVENSDLREVEKAEMMKGICVSVGR
ncbi:MAG: hypothetical protein K5750_00955 [Eubacterium sp.]|nr:hypothetical protein [Eubacterium sp.]